MKTFKEKGLNIDRLPLLESLMSQGNGYVGTRGYLEEFSYPHSVRGNYVNGIYERIPMIHAEWAWGFPLNSDRMPNLIDLFAISIFLDEEEVVIDGEIEDFVRELDFEDGLSRRSYQYLTTAGKTARISFEELLSFPYKELRSWTLNITYDGKIEVRNNIDFHFFNVSSKEDPRLAYHDYTLAEVVKAQYESGRGEILIETLQTKIQILLDFIDTGEFNSTSVTDDDAMRIAFTAKGSLRLERMVKCRDSIRNNDSEFIPREELYIKQKEFMQQSEQIADIEFLDNEELTAAMQLKKFHLLQSTTQDVYGNIAAKGLSGEGYEGHYFWDTEIFMFPVLLLWAKKRARDLLLFRYNTLPAARFRALELGHRNGACFPWRTISGTESSGYFPAGTAQYHINFDIAYTFIQYWLSGKDLDFLADYGMEVILETARTALETGSFQSDGFHIHCVTGPDEYTTLVSDNYYTNKMAQYNLEWAVKLWDILEKERPGDWLRLTESLKLKDHELEKMEKAAQEMVYIYDHEKGILGQDSTFLSKSLWPEENDKRPLLLHYHPLTIYRHQILKQADTALALYLVPDVDEEVMRRTFYYYEKINTHDSSLSPSATVLLACRLRDEDLAYKYFIEGVYLDVRDRNNNTANGLHMANIGGTLLAVLSGFGGIRMNEFGLHLDPFVPEQLGRIRYRFTWYNTVLEVYLAGEEVDIKRISGPPVELVLRGENIIVGQKAVLLDLDGVLTGTSDNHYQGWKRMSKELGFDLPEEFRDRLRGISRLAALQEILDYFGLEYSEEEKQELANRKNNYYIESISAFTPANLYPGALNLLQALRDRGAKIGLVSASKNAGRLIERLGIKEYFDYVFDPADTERGKPYPDPFLKAAEMLSMRPQDCIGVEDAQAGVKSIKSAGMTAVGIGKDDLDEADAIFDTIEEASSYLLDWLEV
ncbi:MAG TPA: beta-phosphoglucomutase [Clostridiaceae bacterium]|nr:beta-phosphoglucomutase [Clostridiaceae bacterium]